MKISLLGKYIIYMYIYRKTTPRSHSVIIEASTVTESASPSIHANPLHPIPRSEPSKREEHTLQKPFWKPGNRLLFTLNPKPLFSTGFGCVQASWSLEVFTRHQQHLKLNSFMAFKFRCEAQGRYNQPCADFVHVVFVPRTPKP